jgi:hypothetical protein
MATPPNFRHLTAANVAYLTNLLKAQHEIRGDVVFLILHHPASVTALIRHVGCQSRLTSVTATSFRRRALSARVTIVVPSALMLDQVDHQCTLVSSKACKQEIRGPRMSRRAYPGPPS